MGQLAGCNAPAIGPPWGRKWAAAHAAASLCVASHKTSKQRGNERARGAARAAQEEEDLLRLPGHQGLALHTLSAELWKLYLLYSHKQLRAGKEGQLRRPAR